MQHKRKNIVKKHSYQRRRRRLVVLVGHCQRSRPHFLRNYRRFLFVTTKTSRKPSAKTLSSFARPQTRVNLKNGPHTTNLETEKTASEKGYRLDIYGLTKYAAHSSTYHYLGKRRLIKLRPVCWHRARLLKLPDFPSGHIVLSSFVCALSGLRLTCVTGLMSIIHHGRGACVTESMSVLTDPATYGILISELRNCPRTPAVLGELAAQWQQMMGPFNEYREQEQDTDRRDRKSTMIEGRGSDPTRRDGPAAHHSEGLHVRSLHGCGTLVRSTRLES